MWIGPLVENGAPQRQAVGTFDVCLARPKVSSVRTRLNSWLTHLSIHFAKYGLVRIGFLLENGAQRQAVGTFDVVWPGRKYRPSALGSTHDWHICQSILPSVDWPYLGHGHVVIVLEYLHYLRPRGVSVLWVQLNSLNCFLSLLQLFLLYLHSIHLVCSIVSSLLQSACTWLSSGVIYLFTQGTMLFRDKHCCLVGLVVQRIKP